MDRRDAAVGVVGTATVGTPPAARIIKVSRCDKGMMLRLLLLCASSYTSDISLKLAYRGFWSISGYMPRGMQGYPLDLKLSARVYTMR